MVRIPGFHPGGPGSIPGAGICLFSTQDTTAKTTTTTYAFVRVVHIKPTHNVLPIQCINKFSILYVCNYLYIYIVIHILLARKKNIFMVNYCSFCKPLLHSFYNKNITNIYRASFSSKVSSYKR